MDSIKINIYLRIAILIVLIAIGSSIIYFKYGTPPNIQDSIITDTTGLKIADCRQTMIYYAEHELRVISPDKANELKQSFNLSNLKIFNDTS